ncbi:MAG TPA: hypothetical protein VKV17_22135 [Bryobacteraceae bacterium]|nr:hypothetical protein [Bryobacteraceae bacterium]
MLSEEEASTIKRRHATRLLKLPGVSGVGIEKDAAGNYLLVIHIDSDQPEVVTGLPEQVEGLPVRLVRTGPFRKL